jgi:predicted nucleotidyltransferase
VARGEAGPDSDGDFLAKFEPSAGPSSFGLDALRDELAALAEQRLVDLATPAVLENPCRRATILCDLVELYAAR